MTRRIGFSTGALALGDFSTALSMLRGQPVNAIELSALRLEELPVLADAVPALDLSCYDHVSVHAPGRFAAVDESRIISTLRTFTGRGWPVVLHPDAAHDLSLWREMGPMLLVENMDKRKPVGRTADELGAIFAKLPEARFCFDIAHARQCDGTMTEAYRILTAFGDRIAQVHISEVNTRSGHGRISLYASHAFQKVARLVPADAPAIIESRVPADEIAEEVERARIALTPLARDRAIA